MVAETRWWGDFTVPKDSTLRWQIGPTTLWIHRTARDWRLASLSGSDPFDSRLGIAEPLREGDERPAEGTVTRYALRDEDDTVHLVPAHADRPVIVNAERPFFLPPGEEATLYIGTPLWVRILVGRRAVELTELPLFRPSDTWFGPNTLSGELCYAARTTARLQLENLPLRPHRAVSAARIRNRANTSLPLEKLKLPVKHLSIYCSEAGHMWTEQLTLERQADSEHANVRLDGKPTRIVGAVTFVSPPREKISKGFLVETFGGFFAKKPEKKDERVPRKAAAPADPDGRADV